MDIGWIASIEDVPSTAEDMPIGNVHTPSSPDTPLAIDCPAYRGRHGHGPWIFAVVFKLASQRALAAQACGRGIGGLRRAVLTAAGNKRVIKSGSVGRTPAAAVVLLRVPL